MKLFQRIFFAAVLSGLAAGLAMSAVQQWRVAPLILAAEVYENAAPAEEAPAEHSHDAGTPVHSHEETAPAHEHDENAWAPQDGAERIFYTVLANLLGAIGFAFVLAAVSVLSGIEITGRNGVIWGLGGFIALQLAPAFGLPPISSPARSGGLALPSPPERACSPSPSSATGPASSSPSC